MMALKTIKTKPVISTVSSGRSNSGAALEKRLRRDTLAPELAAVLKEQLALGYMEEFVLVDIEELCSALSQLPASLKNTIRGFGAKVGPRGGVEVNFHRGKDASAFLQDADTWRDANPDAELREIGGLALVTGITIGGVRYKIEDNEMVTIQPNKKGHKAQTVKRFYILKVSNYWAGASSSRASI